LETRLPERERLGSERRLAHPTEARDERHGLHLRPGAGADEVRAKLGQLPGAPDEVLVSRRGQFDDLVKSGIALVETGAAALLQSQAGMLRAVEHRRGVIADIVAS